MIEMRQHHIITSLSQRVIEHNRTTLPGQRMCQTFQALVHGRANPSVVYEEEKAEGKEEMAKGPKPAELQLDEEEQNEREALVRRQSTPQQIAQRARMILGAAEGKRNAQIARDLGVCVDTVRKWRMHGIGLQAVSREDLSVSERLADVPRPGRPSQITAEQTCQMIALACEQPKERPISHWTGREMAEEVMARGIVPRISARPAARVFKKKISNRI
jgi:putative transposase